LLNSSEMTWRLTRLSILQHLDDKSRMETAIREMRAEAQTREAVRKLSLPL
jgi:hypothetical protein